MTDPAALTDEELAEWEADYVAVMLWPERDVPRLIAALRASHQREAVVTADRDSWKRMCAIATSDADKARAEVKRLSELLAFYAGSDDPLRGP